MWKEGGRYSDDLHVTSSRLSVVKIARRKKAITTDLEPQLTSMSKRQSKLLEKKTHSPPSKKITRTPIFLPLDICNFDTARTGSTSIVMSSTPLKHCTTSTIVNGSRHFPGTSSSQALCTGEHWNADTKLLAKSQAITSMPTMLIRLRNWGVEKTRR